MSTDGISKSELEGFVNEAMANGWPGNTVPRTDADFPGFYGGNYRRGLWRCLDIWSGATTDAGMLIVFFDEAAVWTCGYRGGVLHGTRHVDKTAIAENEVFDFLIAALRAPQDGLLKLRGPAELTSEDGRWQYRFVIRGDVESFIGTERIYECGSVCYERILIGGRVGDGIAYGPGSLGIGGWE